MGRTICPNLRTELGLGSEYQGLMWFKLLPLVQI